MPEPEGHAPSVGFFARNELRIRLRLNQNKVFVCVMRFCSFNFNLKGIALLGKNAASWKWNKREDGLWIRVRTAFLFFCAVIILCATKFHSRGVLFFFRSFKLSSSCLILINTFNPFYDQYFVFINFKIYIILHHL